MSEPKEEVISKYPFSQMLFRLLDHHNLLDHSYLTEQKDEALDDDDWTSSDPKSQAQGKMVAKETDYFKGYRK